MSANLDLVRSIMAAVGRGDFSTAESVHPDIEFVVADGPDPGNWKGLAAFREVVRNRVGAWEKYRHLVDEYRELDNERVLVLAHRSGRGKASGLELGQIRTDGALLFQLRDGKVTRLIGYNDRERALADLGLPREGDAADPPG
jgi:ketosteroid isomerase-like protein